MSHDTLNTSIKASVVIFLFILSTCMIILVDNKVNQVKDEPKIHTPFDFNTETTRYIKYDTTELIYEYSYSGAHLVQMIRDNENVFILQFDDKDNSDMFMLSYIDDLIRSQ